MTTTKTRNQGAFDFRFTVITSVVKVQFVTDFLLKPTPMNGWIKEGPDTLMSVQNDSSSTPKKTFWYRLSTRWHGWTSVPVVSVDEEETAAGERAREWTVWTQKQTLNLTVLSL